MSEFIGGNWGILSPIILLSIGAVSVIIERALFFRKIRWKSPDRLPEALGEIGRLPAVEILSILDDTDRSPARELLDFGLTSGVRSIPAVYRQRLEALRDRHLDRMERHLSILPGIGNVATLLGLFGTVSGMITTFSRMNETGSSDPYVLAGGISRALVTTAAGLAVAIPAMFSHHLLEVLVDRHADRMDEVVNECLYKAGAAGARTREPKTATT